MKDAIQGVLVYMIIPVFFISFIVANIESSKKYFKKSNNWAPKVASGPLLYDIAFTNPSKFSLENKSSLLALYYTQGKKITTSSYQGMKQLSLYYRLECSLNVDGELAYNGYNYNCPNLDINKNLSQENRSCLDRHNVEFDGVVLCDESIASSSHISAIMFDNTLYLSSVD